MQVFCYMLCICTRYVSSAQGDQIRESDNLKLGLQRVVTYQVGSGKQIWVLYKVSQCC